MENQRQLALVLVVASCMFLGALAPVAASAGVREAISHYWVPGLANKEAAINELQALLRDDASLQGVELREINAVLKDYYQSKENHSDFEKMLCYLLNSRREDEIRSTFANTPLAAATARAIDASGVPLKGRIEDFTMETMQVGDTQTLGCELQNACERSLGGKAALGKIRFSVDAESVVRIEGASTLRAVGSGKANVYLHTKSGKELDRKSVSVIPDVIPPDYSLKLPNLLVQHRHEEMKLSCSKAEMGQMKPFLSIQPRSKAVYREIDRDESSITFDVNPRDSGYIWIKAFDDSNNPLDSIQARILYFPSRPFSKKWPMLTSGATVAAGVLAIVFRSQENDLKNELDDLESDPDFSDKYWDPDDRTFRNKYDNTYDDWTSKGNWKDTFYISTGILAAGSAYLWGKYYYSYYRPSQELKKEYLDKYGIEVSCTPARVILAYRF